jgi:hypothetical protein
MPVHEVAEDPGTVLQAAVAPNVQALSEPELTTTLIGGETAPAEPQGYEYIRQDGTVERAASAPDAIRLCPVLGKLAMKDPAAANLLLDMALLGQAKMAEKAEQTMPTRTESEAEPEKFKPAEVGENRPVDSTVPLAATAPVDITAERERAVETHFLQEHLAEQSKQPLHVSAAVKSQTREAVNDFASLEQQYVFAAANDTQGHIENRASARSDPAEQVTASPPAEGQKPAERITSVTVDADTAPVADKVSDVIISSFVEAAASTALVPEQTEVHHGAEDSDRKPVEIYEDFYEALTSFMATRPVVEQTVGVGTSDTTGTEFGKSTASEVLEQPVPAIVAVVAERLEVLAAEEQETAAIIIEDIMQTVHIVESLAAEGAAPEAIAAKRKELEELIVLFFECLSIEYEEADIKRFASVLFHADFQHLQTQAAGILAADLETDAEDKIHHLIGKIILFYLARLSPNMGSS